MRRTILAAAACAAVLAGLNSWAEEEAPELPPSRLATLYRHDPVTQGISLATGAGGKVIRDHQVYNFQSDIDFGNYNPGALTAGIEGGRTGVVVDLGSAADLEKRYGYAETVGGGQGYASIRFEELGLVIRDGKGGVQPLAEAKALFAGEERGRKQGTAPVAVGHIYLVRITDRHDRNFERIAKLLVVAHAPDQYVTFRWDLLRDEPGQRG